MGVFVAGPAKLGGLPIELQERDEAANLKPMKLDELQREAEQLTPDEQRKLIGFLVAMNIRRDEHYRQELSRRLKDQDPEGWMSLKDAEQRLKSDGI